MRDIPVFYINLDKDTQKKRRVESVLHRYGFKHIERFSAVLAESKDIGCNLSHINLLQKIISQSIYPVLVVEDDIDVFKWRDTISFPDKADAVYLGISQFGYTKDVDLTKNWAKRELHVSEIEKETHRTHNMLSSHAILRLNPEYDLKCIDQMKKVLKNKKKYITNDVAVAMIHPKNNVYSLNIPIFYQNDYLTRRYTKFSLKDHNKVVVK